MTDQDQLDAMAAAATPGPFSEEGGYIKAGKAALTTVADLRYKNGSADRAFIVALVNAYPDLRAAVRERDELRAALDLSTKALGSFLWLGNNLHNSGTDTFRDMYRAALDDARTAYGAGAALHSKDGAS